VQEITRRIQEFNKTRIPGMVRLKYKFMRENMFRFFRGTCHIFYEDLARDAKIPVSPPGWICGDLHLENYGSFRSANGQVYFDLNDFDEALLAPVAWEAVRLTTSIFVGFESLDIENEKAEKMAKLFLKSYSTTLAAGKPDYIEPATAQGIICDFLTKVGKRKQQVILNKRTTIRKKKLKLLTDSPKHFSIGDPLRKDLCRHLNDWLKTDDRSPYNYEALDAVFRLAGTGSVGLQRYVFLLRSLNENGYKHILLDMKEAAPSGLLPFVTLSQPCWQSEAERVVTLQRRLQNRCPVLLSTSLFKGKSFIMQEMQPTKDSIDFRLLADRYRDMYSVVDTMGMLSASSQLRSSGQQGSATTDELKRFGADPDWQATVLEHAREYALRVKQYYNDWLPDYPELRQMTKSVDPAAAGMQFSASHCSFPHIVPPNN
jgi:uncharacterized protein (DUF2252 family)